jgi:hypothetical protein
MKSAYFQEGGRPCADFRKALHRHPQAFALDAFETRQLDSLLERGYSFTPGFFSPALIDHIASKADALFRDIVTGSEQKAEIVDPLVRVSEVLDIVFHESILKIVAHFFRHVPPVYRASIARYFPNAHGSHLNCFRQETHDSDSLEILIDLEPVDYAGGPLVYVPGSNRYGSYRPRLLNAFGIPVDPRRLEDWEVERLHPRSTWVTLCGARGSVTAIHGRGLAKGPAWESPGDINNRPRTAIRIDIAGYTPGIKYEWNGNAMQRWNFERMSKFQQAFAHPAFVEEEMLA